MSAGRGAARREQGYTLVEMLVVLSITGLLAGVLLAAMGAGAAGLRAMRFGDDDLDTVVAAQNRLRALVGRMRPERRLVAAQGVVDLRGSAHDLAFFAEPQPAEAPDEIKRYRLLLTAAGDLVAYEANGLDERIDLDAPSLVGWQPNPLLHNVAQVSLAYFGPTPLGSAPQWQLDWQGRRQTPLLVRIRVEFAPGDPRHWPDLVIHPAASSNTPCHLNPATSHCETA